MSKKGGKTKQSPQEPSGGKTCSQSCSYFKMIFKLVLLAAVAGGGFYIYTKMSEVPTVPKLDPEFNWGPNELKGKKLTKITPFKVEFNETMINDLRERLLHRRPFTPPLEGIGFQYGFNTKFLEQVIDFWRNKYDFKQREQFLNQFPQFITNIQGLDMHYIHVKPKVSDGVRVLPLLILHGWPGSVREFYEAIPELTKANKYGFAFEVIAPSLPGYGFSQAAVKPGLNPLQVAQIMKNLMERVGHKKFYIQGGDWGALIGKHLTIAFPENILGYHSNMLAVQTPGSMLKLWLGSWYPSLVEPDHPELVYPILSKYSMILEETGYFHIQASKPDTVGVALTDSPVGLAAYILEKFSAWTNLEFRRAQDGEMTKKFTLTQLLDNIMIYWSTNSITTSMRLYSETFNKATLSLNLESIPTVVPTWALKARNELVFQPDSVLKHGFLNLLGSTYVDDGGHFFAFEMPQVFADDVAKAVDTFERYHLAKIHQKSEL